EVGSTTPRLRTSNGAARSCSSCLTCSTTVDGDKLRSRAAARNPRSLRTARKVLACTRLSMSKLLVRLVDCAKWNSPIESVENTARGGKLDLAPDLGHARSDMRRKDRRRGWGGKPGVDAG